MKTEYYERLNQQRALHNNAVAKARNRGNVASVWYGAGNKLTKETIAEFKSLMKKADRDYDALTKKQRTP